VLVVLFEDAFEKDGGEEFRVVAFEEGGVVERGGHEEVAGPEAPAVGTVAGYAGLIGETPELEDFVSFCFGRSGEAEQGNGKEGKGSLHLKSGMRRLGYASREAKARYGASAWFEKAGSGLSHGLALATRDLKSILKHTLP